MHVFLFLENFTVVPKIKNPEKYLENPENIYFESELKNRPYELVRENIVDVTYMYNYFNCLIFLCFLCVFPLQLIDAKVVKTYVAPGRIREQKRGRKTAKFKNYGYGDGIYILVKNIKYL